jgi:serine/threonine protein kinase
MSPGQVLAGRFEAVREIGRGSAGASWLVRDRAGGGGAVAKLIALGQLSDWKQVELLEREAAVLKELDHERIPAYLDSFQADLDGAPCFVLLRAYAEGQSLQDRVEKGWRGTEEQIRGIGARLLAIVAYIHAVRPPVIHRDINPRNVILREDGEVFLVDFGGVQDAIRLSEHGRATVVGSPGYTPMEQFVGRATVRSDLYAAAATLLFLLTHHNPADLPTRDMKIDLPSIIELSSLGLSRVLTNWLEPDEAKRTLPIADAIDLLEQDTPGESNALRGPADAEAPAPAVHPPHGSRIQRAEADAGITYVVPERGRSAAAASTGVFALFWLGFVAFWTFMAVSMQAPIIFPLFSLPFWAAGIGMLYRTLRSVFGKLHIRIDRDGFTYARRLFGMGRTRNAPIADVGACQIVEASGQKTPGGMRVDIGARTLSFGEGLSDRERQWLRDRLAADVKGCPLT